MFWSLVSLFVALAVVRLVWYAVSRFWAWLAKGKRLHSAVQAGAVGEQVRQSVEAADREVAQRVLEHSRDGEGEGRTRITGEQLAEVMAALAQERTAYIDRMHFGWYQVVMLFFVASILGLVLEEVWMFVTAGLTESRVGLVWGPFSPLYGVGALLLTLVGFKLRRRQAPWWAVFLVSMLVGGLLEQAVGWSMETFMGAVSWDYSDVPGHLSKWVSVPFLFFWGILGLVWTRLIMPDLLFRIGQPTTRRQVVFVGLLALYLSADIFMTLACFTRIAEREHGIAPQGAFEQWVDTHYTNEFVSNRFQNMVFSDG